MALTDLMSSCVTDPGFLVVFLLVFLLVVYLRGRQSTGPLPPGPPCYPVVGSYLSLRGSQNPFEQVVPLAQKYGDVMFLKIFSAPVLVLSGYATLQEALVKQTDLFSNRPDFTSIVTLFKDYGQGIVWNNGASWRELRKFALAGMREVGVGKQGVEEKIDEEVTSFITSLNQYEGQPVNFKFLAMKATNNVISNVCFSRRFEYDDVKMSELLKLFEDLFKPQPALAGLADMMPWLSALPPVKKSQAEVIKRVDPMFAFVHQRFSEHEESHDDDINRDFVDLFYSRRQDDSSNLSEKNLTRVITDLYGAGAETTSTSLAWHVLYMLHYPDVMKKCQDEIDQVVGRGRPVRMADKAHLPFVEATGMEVLRMSNTALVTLPHALNEGGEFRGYRLPARTMVLANLQSVHMQPDLWTTPDRFHPPRFLLQDGSVDKKLPLVAFGLGPRMCTGELLAKQELFLFFANLLQRFDFLSASPELPSLKGILGLVNAPQPFEVRFVPR